MLARHSVDISRADEGSRFLGYLGAGLVDISKCLDRWLKFHQFALMAAAVHALDLTRDITRSASHVLRLQLSLRKDYEGPPSKAFSVESVEVSAITEVNDWDQQWHDSLEFLARLRKESEAKGEGTVAGVCIECAPLGIQLLPLGSLKDLHVVKREVGWKNMLIEHLEEGNKIAHFQSKEDLESRVLVVVIALM
jgi:splicing suppressor protein 51